MRNQAYQSKRRASKSILSSGFWDFPFHPGKGGVTIAAALMAVALMLAAVDKEMSQSEAESDAPDGLSDRVLPPTASVDEPGPLTLAELLLAMRNRLRDQNVTSQVRVNEGTLRVMSTVAHYALSRADLAPEREVDADAIADTLAWAVHCHIDFSGEMDLSDEDGGASACSQSRSTRQSAYTCLPGKGKVALAGIRFEGHADAVPFKPASRKRAFNNNQELSDARAARFAQRILGCAEENLAVSGTPVKIPFEVSGHADDKPAEKSGRDPRNRRVEIHFSEDGLPPEGLIR